MGTPITATSQQALHASWPPRPRWPALAWLAGLRALVAVALLAPLAAFTAGQGKLSQAAWLGLLPLVPWRAVGSGCCVANGSRPSSWPSSSGPMPSSCSPWSGARVACSARTRR